MKKTIYLILLLCLNLSFSQNENQRIENIKNQLMLLADDNVGLTENFKTEVDVTNITLSNFLLALAEVHKLNINPSEDLNQINISPKFPNVIVTDLLVFLCKNYNLTIEFTGNILSIKPYVKKQEEPKKREIPISYNPASDLISLDIKGDELYDVFRRIMDESGKNLVFSPDIQNKALTIYIKNTPFDVAMNKLAYSNLLYIEQTKDGFFKFEDDSASGISNQNNSNAGSNAEIIQRPKRRRSSNFFFKIKDKESKLLEVDFQNTSIEAIINDISSELDIDIFTATPLSDAGTASFKAKSISFDQLLVKLFESQKIALNTQVNTSNSQQNSLQTQNNETNNSSNNFNFKIEDNIYYFGTENQLSVRSVEIIHLLHRSIDLLTDPSGVGNSRSAGRNNFNNSNNFSNSNSGSFNNNNRQRNNNIGNNQFGNNGNSSLSSSDQSEDFINTLVPEELSSRLAIKIDRELNSFYVVGSAANIERFKAFVKKIDRPVPVILIEVMIIEVSKNATVDTGVSWGIGDAPSETQGGIFPTTDLTLGAQTINKIIGGFDGFGSLNIGRVVPNFFATIKAMEASGDLKVRSSPKIATLNGHRASFSNGQTTYYTVTDQAIIGTDNPITQSAVNYIPIDAELGITIKPLVSGDEQVTLDISVIQSTFGERIAADAPPDIVSREFSSLIRMKNQDIAVLGGLEEQSKSDSRTGVPFLARVPLIKYLFSRKRREARKSKLTVLIKPTVYY